MKGIVNRKGTLVDQSNMLTLDEWNNLHIGGVYIIGCDRSAVGKGMLTFDEFRHTRNSRYCPTLISRDTVGAQRQIIRIEKSFNGHLWRPMMFFVTTVAVITLLSIALTLDEDLYSRNKHDINISLATFFVVSSVFTLFSYLNTVAMVNSARKQSYLSCVNGGILALAAQRKEPKASGSHGLFSEKKNHGSDASFSINDSISDSDSDSEQLYAIV
jgi:hypothetical protein